MPIATDRNVLVVDDDASVRRLLSRFLKPRGWKVTEAANAAEAIARFRAGRYNAVVSDVEMGEVDGIALAGKLLALQPTLRIVLISGSIVDEERTRRLNIEPVLPKPFDLKILSERLLAPIADTAQGNPLG